jgi:hypothetical protein
VISAEAAHHLEMNDRSAACWTQSLHESESRFQCANCECVWIGMTKISPCPECGVKICAKCWEAVTDECHKCGEVVTLDEAQMTSGFRACPRCRLPFVKEENDCNHVVCPKCLAHICYHCGEMFTGEDIYKEHLGLTCPLSSAFVEQEWDKALPSVTGNDL